MTITTIPTRTVGSLGPTKIDRRAVSDPYQQLGADEYNLLADCAIHSVNTIGTETGYASTSLQGRVDDLEAQAPFTAGDNYIRTWHFVSAAEVTEWNNGGVDPPTHSSNPPGYAIHALDGADAVCSCTGGDITHDQFAPHIKLRLVISGDLAAANEVAIRCIDSATGNERWGVLLETGGAIRAMVMTGGAPSYEALTPTWTTDKFLSLEFYESSTGKLVVVHTDVASGETTTTTALSVPTGPFGIDITSGKTSGAGSILAMDYITLSDTRNLATSEVVYGIIGT
jgi:hypothetical protein